MNRRVLELSRSTWLHLYAYSEGKTVALKCLVHIRRVLVISTFNWIERFDGEADESAVSWEGAAACDTSRLPYLSCYYHYHYPARSYSPGESRPFALCSVYIFFLPTHPSPVK